MKVPAALYHHRVQAKYIAVALFLSNNSKWYVEAVHYVYLLSQLTLPQLDRLVGLSMLIAATSIFVYYTVWTLFMVRPDQ